MSQQRGKHRKPSAAARIANRPMQLGVAAGVAGTVAVTGTVVASADTSTRHHQRPAAIGLAALAAQNSAAVQAALQTNGLHQAVQRIQGDQARAAAEARTARIKARKVARRKAAQRRAAARAAAAAAAAEQARTEAAAAASRSDERMTASAASVLAIAAAHSGDAYSYGAAGPDAFDCSGFTMYVFGKVGISLPHSAAAQASVATPVSSPQPGDLVFVHNGAGGIGHVAIYAGGGYWYEASNPSVGVGKHAAWSSNVSYGRVL